MRSSLFLLCVCAPAWVGAACTPGDDVTTSDTDGPQVVPIGPAGGEASSVNGILTIIIPPGALTQTVDVVITESFEAPASIGPAFRVMPDLELSMNLTAIYRYSDAIIGDRDEQILTIGSDQGGFWEPLERIALDTTTQRVTVVDPEISFHYGLIENIELSETESGTMDSADDTSTSGDTTASSMTTVAMTDDSSSGTTGGSSDSDSTGASASSSSDSGSGSGSGSESGTTGGGGDNCGDGSVDAGEVCLLEGIAINAGSQPSAVRLLDFDGDGDLDLVVSNEGEDTVEIRLGTGTGFFLSAEVVDVGNEPTDLVLGDFAGDGEVDIVTSNRASNNVSLLVGIGDGTFMLETTYGATVAAEAITAGLVNAGADLDLLVGGETNAALLLGDGTDFGAPSITAIGSNVTDIESGDFNGMFLDLITTGAGSVSLLAGNGAGLFGAPSTTAILGVGTALAVFDFNGDGDLDVAVTSANMDLVTILLGNGVGGFGGGVPFGTGGTPGRIALGDVTNDGDMDLVIVNRNDGTVSVLAGNGVGGFVLAATVNVGGNPSDAAIGDINGDGAADIVVSNFDDADVSLLISDP